MQLVMKHVIGATRNTKIKEAWDTHLDAIAKNKNTTKTFAKLLAR
jgi:hypothetical protein